MAEKVPDMTITIEELIERDRARRLIERERDQPAVPLESELAARFSEDSADSLVEYSCEHRFGFKPENVGWDLRRLFGGPDDLGHGIFELAVCLTSTADECRITLPDGSWARQVYIEQLWESFDRPKTDSDLLLISLADEVRFEGWDCPPDVAKALAVLEAIAEQSRAARDAAEEAAHQARLDAEAAADKAAEEAAWKEWDAWEEAVKVFAETNPPEHQAWQAALEEHRAGGPWAKVELTFAAWKKVRPPEPPLFETARMKRLRERATDEWLILASAPRTQSEIDAWRNKFPLMHLEGIPDVTILPFPQQPFVPPPGPTEAIYDDEPEPLIVVSAASFAGRKAPKREWLVSTVIPAHIVGAIYGDGAVGKSLLAIMLGVACVTGVLWLGYTVQRGPFVYLCCEDDLDEVHRRLEDVCRGMGVDMAALGDFHIVPLADEDSVLATADGRSSVLVTTKRYNQVAELVERVRPVLVIGDTLTDVYAASEIDRMLAKQFVKAMRRLVVPYGGTFLLLAHPSLDGLRTGRGTSGSTGWNNSVRWRGFLDKILAEDGTEPDNTKRVLRLLKANYGPQGGEIPLRWHEGCYLLDSDAASGDSSPAMKEVMAAGKFLELLDVYESEGRVVSASPSSNYAPSVFAKDPRAQGFRKKQLADAMNRLFANKQIKIGPVAPDANRHARTGLVRVRKPA
jgi:RecA-family ATPase